MSKVIDVAAAIVEEEEFISTMKLQKLMYYSQVFSLVVYNKPLFEEDFQAWANGPVLKSLYDIHKGKFLLDIHDLSAGNSENLCTDERASIQASLDAFGLLSGSALSQQTHAETPWIHARSGLQSNVRSDRLITKDSIQLYYSKQRDTYPLFRGSHEAQA